MGVGNMHTSDLLKYPIQDIAMPCCRALLDELQAASPRTRQQDLARCEPGEASCRPQTPPNPAVYTLLKHIYKCCQTKTCRRRATVPRSRSRTPPKTNHPISSLIIQNPARNPPDNWDLVSATELAQTCHAADNQSVKTYLSNVSASRYAFSTSQAINARSPRKNTQLRNVDHAKSRWTTNSAVNSKADCHA